MLWHLYKNFNLTGPSEILNDVFVTLIDKIDLKDPIKQEGYQIHILKAKTSLGLNIGNGLQG